jgi:Uma2 family endonuclease
VQHYLILDPEDRTVTHHKRGATAIETRVVSEGSLSLNPPGLELRLADIFGAARA